MLHTGRLGHKHFTLAKQQAMITGHGVQCLIWPCLQCPCLLEDRQFAPTCPSCGGTGRLYPTEAHFATTLLLHQEDARRTFAEAGTWTSGDIRASVLPGIRLAERDKVAMIDARAVVNDEVLVRGLDDRVRYDSGVRLLVVADRERVYREGRDYHLQPPATIAWLSTGIQPSFGAQYTCRYEAMPLFLVVNDSPRLRVENRVVQSSEVVLRRLDRLSEEGL